MSINHLDANNAMGAFILSIHKSLSTSFWYCMYNSCKFNPEVVEIPNTKLGDKDKRIEALEKKRRLRELYLMSFRLITGLSQDDYKNLLVIAGLLMKDKKYGGYRVEANEWKKFVSKIADEAEFDGAVLLTGMVV